MKQAASARKSSRSRTTSGSSGPLRPKTRRPKTYVICVENTGYPASLEVGKVYQTLGAPENGPARRLRVIDESGEDYIFPATFFRPIEVSVPVQRALARAGSHPPAESNPSR